MTLRIFFDAPPSASRAFAWGLFDARGVCIREGRDTVDQWPRDDDREAVLAADLAPLLAFKLPPLSASRLESAVRLQLEDRLATPLSAQRIVIGAQQRDGWVRVVLAEHALLEALRKFGIARAFSEAELIAADEDAWHWCVSPEGRGFVRRDRASGGSTFALDLSSEKTLPAELTLALSAETAPPKWLQLHAALPAEMLNSWQQNNHACRLAVEPPWRWTRADPTRFAEATELLPQFETVAPSSSRSSGKGWRIAAVLVGLALALHILATVAVWGSSVWQRWQISRGWQALAVEAGLPDNTNAATIPAQWSRAYAATRHRAGLSAPDDALPLLARAASSLRALPSGTVRSAVYADRAWTFECTSLDATTQKTLEAGLRRAGLQAMSGNTAAGYRIRIQSQEAAP
ncbi:MAG: type II secretion system protein GspL [Betaproteobacteria bacterium]|nr:type II secretion system protein GspL [Betaproteobacteria bacterium]